MSVEGPAGTEGRVVLAIDSAGAGCSAAIWRDGPVAAKFEEMPRGQSERLFPMIEELLGEARLEYRNIDAIGVTIGPGAFTGLRIGLAAAKGLALALSVPLIGISSFEAVAASVCRQAHTGQCPAIVLESKRKDFYLQIFSRDGIALTEPASVQATDLKRVLSGRQILLAGDAKMRAAEVVAELENVAIYKGDDKAHAYEVARLAALRRGGPGTRVEPLYLRPPDVTLPGSVKT